MEQCAVMEREPLRRLFDSYSGCLALDQGYMAESQGREELDLDRLEAFLDARAELLAEAEQSFEALTMAGRDTGGREHDEALRRKVVTVLEEMTGLENSLSVFLGERLKEIGEAICQLRRTRPAFQRYSHLGGDKAAPSLITRRE